MSFTKSNGLLAAAFLLSSVVAANTFAQQDPSEGVVRITDGRVRSNVRQVNGQVVPSNGFQNGPSATSYSDGSQLTSVGFNTGHFQNGNCPTGDCPTGGAYGNGQCPHCRGGAGGHFSEHYCKHSPDYGYSPPAKYPLHRRGVEYTTYYPNNWYGAGADYSQSQAPMVYQATDTTQLGFYYQHVPYWQPQPNRLPPRPVPAQWHITAPAMQATSGYGNNFGGHGWSGFGGRFCRSGNCPYDSFSAEGYPTQQGSQPSGVSTPSMQPTPVPAETAPRPIETQSPSTLPSDDSYDQSSIPSPLPPLQTTLPSPSPR